MRLILILCLCLTVYLNGTALASGCYTPIESEAEQGIRIHSELMVIGLNCAHMADSEGNNLYVAHSQFTKKHEDLFARYEDILKEYMSKNGTKDTEAALHTLRTEFANKISVDAAKMRPDIFCKAYAERISKVAGMNEKTLRKWAATPFKGHPVSQPVCEH